MCGGVKFSADDRTELNVLDSLANLYGAQSRRGEETYERES